MHYSLCYCVVGPDEEAVDQLVVHFSAVIDSIVANTWNHYPIHAKKRGKGPLVFHKTEMEQKKVLEMNPKCFLLQPSCLQLRTTGCRDSIVASFRMFAFATYNSVIPPLFGEDYVLHPGSGIDALFPPRPVGRPKKRRLAAKRDMKDAETSSVLDILAQVIDSLTKESFVLVHWAGSAVQEATWTSMASLSADTRVWWSSEAERRFPFIDLAKESPVFRITGGPVTVIFDESADDVM